MYDKIHNKKKKIKKKKKRLAVPKDVQTTAQLHSFHMLAK